MMLALLGCGENEKRRRVVNRNRDGKPALLFAPQNKKGARCQFLYVALLIF